MCPQKKTPALSLAEQRTFFLNEEKPPFTCVNCGRKNNDGRLYCNEVCQQEAEIIRYARRARLDGRINDPDVQEAIKIKIAIVLGGGYGEEARVLSQQQRAEVIARYDGLCAKCREAGNIVDHINGSSDSPENLQLLCAKCHNEKTLSHCEPIANSKEAPRVTAHAARIQKRIESEEPLKLCDLSEWSAVWRTIKARRRKSI